jgi:hypothetical protein
MDCLPVINMFPTSQTTHPSCLGLEFLNKWKTAFLLLKVEKILTCSVVLGVSYPQCMF